MDFTPLIDIVFNLLLFFILSTNYVQQTSFQLEIPGAASADQATEKGIIVTLTRDGRVFVGGDEVPLPALEEHLKALVPAPESPPPLLLQADRLVYHERVVALLDIARRVGVKDLEVATIREDRRR
jgi:biopolymer transport protein ExbD